MHTLARIACRYALAAVVILTLPHLIYVISETTGFPWQGCVAP